MQKELDTLADVTVEGIVKKPQYQRIILVFKDGIRLPITDTYFTVCKEREGEGGEGVERGWRGGGEGVERGWRGGGEGVEREEREGLRSEVTF